MRILPLQCNEAIYVQSLLRFLSLHPCIPAVLLVLAAGVVDEESAAFLDGFDDGFVEFSGHCRATPAASDETLSLRYRFAHIIGCVHHDAALFGFVVDARLLPFQPQAQSVLTHIGIAGHEEAQAAHQAVLHIGKTGGVFLAAVPAVAYPGVERQAGVFHVDDVQPAVVARLTEIDNAQVARIAEFAFLQQLAVAAEGEVKGVHAQTEFAETGFFKHHHRLHGFEVFFCQPGHGFIEGCESESGEQSHHCHQNLAHRVFLFNNYAMRFVAHPVKRFFFPNIALSRLLTDIIPESVFI